MHKVSEEDKLVTKLKKNKFFVIWYLEKKVGKVSRQDENKNKQMFRVWLFLDNHHQIICMMHVQLLIGHILYTSVNCYTNTDNIAKRKTHCILRDNFCIYGLQK